MMDALTLELLAAHEPRRALIDEDADVWHAECMRLFIDEYKGSGPDFLTKVSDLERRKKGPCYRCYLGDENKDDNGRSDCPNTSYR